MSVADGFFGVVLCVLPNLKLCCVRSCFVRCLRVVFCVLPILFLTYPCYASFKFVIFVGG